MGNGSSSSQGPTEAGEAEIESLGGGSTVVAVPARTIFSWGLNPVDTKQVQSDLDKFTVDQLRNNIEDYLMIKNYY